LKAVITYLCILVAAPFASQAQDTLAIFTVHAGDYSRENTLVAVDLSGIKIDLSNSRLVLYEEGENDVKPIESQLDMDDGPKLWWVIKKELPVGSFRKYVLRSVPISTAENAPKMQVNNENGNLVVQSNGKNVLQYNLTEAPLPNEAGELFRRTGYIHPLWSPSGEVLTRIHPPDHYHHFGVWNPWTHTRHRGKVIDFWNLGKGEGTVVPLVVTSTTSNDLFAGFKVIHNHIHLNDSAIQGSEVLLREEWKVRVWNTLPDIWTVDLTSTFNNLTDSILTILEYRYQGFSIRATEKWDDKTAHVLTSEGKTKADGNGTRARWCDIRGISAAGTSGILFITNPSNFNYPEPIRIWPVGANKGRENVFFNFNPAMDRDWEIIPGHDYLLRYRMYIYDGKISKMMAEKLWQDFAHPAQVSIDFIRQ
jgi:hypothetical protein